MSDGTISRRTVLGTLAAGVASAALPHAEAQSPFGNMPATPPKRFSVTVRRFDPLVPSRFEDFTLPVDCPDAEHAASAVLSNLIAWTTKTTGMAALPVAFRCMAVTERTD